MPSTKGNLDFLRLGAGAGLCVVAAGVNGAEIGGVIGPEETG